MYPNWTRTLCIALLSCVAFKGRGEVLHVPADYATISQAQAAASYGDEIVLAPGTYKENLFIYDGITLRSECPTSPSVVAATIVDGSATTEPTVVVACPDVTVSGLTLTRGGGGIAFFPGGEAVIEDCRVVDNDGPGVLGGWGVIRRNLISGNTNIGFGFVRGGGISTFSGPILNNVITGNRVISDDTAEGGGIAFVFGHPVEGNEITSNTVTAGTFAAGGGLSYCDHVVSNTIAYNEAIGTNNSYGGCGGGARGCCGEFVNNLVAYNYASYGAGGVYDASTMVRNCVFAYNSAGSYAGGLWAAYGGVANCTFYGNTAGVDGAALRACCGPIANCIIWGNSSPLAPLSDYSGQPIYSCVQPDVPQGRQSISQDPRFVDPASLDFHMQADSPCVDAGNKYYLYTAQNDLDGLCRLKGDKVDMGAYEYGSQPDSDGDLVPDAQELVDGTDSQQADTDDDGLMDGAEKDRGTLGTIADTAAGLSITNTTGALQQAIFRALPNEQISLTTGTYSENVHLLGKTVTIQGPWPPTNATVRQTILNGGSIASVVWLDTVETSLTQLRGLTVANSRNAAICGAGANGSRGLAGITLDSVVLRDNQGRGNGGCAAIDFAYAWMRNCCVHHNTPYASYPVMMYLQSADHCTFADNGGSINFGFVTGVVARNCIFWSPAASPQVTGWSSPTMEYCDINGWSSGGTGNMNSNPLFRDASQGDYRLRSGSPCIDAGTSIGVEFDYEGQARTSMVDIGADEFYATGQEIVVTGGPLRFGNQILGSGPSSSLGVVISNIGTAPLSMTSVSIDGAGAADYSFTTPPDLSLLSPGATRNIDLVFQPSALGNRPAILSIEHDDTDNPRIQVVLSGRGVTDSEYVGLYTGNGPGKSTIGAGGDYETLKAACVALNSTPLTGGDWTFEIISDLTETENVEIGQNLNGNHVTFRPGASANPVITFWTASAPVSFAAHWVIGSVRTPSALASLVPTSGVTIDGCNTPGGTTRNMTVTNSTMSSGRTTLIMVAGDSDGNAIRNCVLWNRYNSSSSTFGVSVNHVFDNATTAALVPDNTLVENNLITNNESGPGQGVTVAAQLTSGGSTTTGSVGTIFRNNDIAARARAFFLANTQECQVTSNTVRVNQTAPGTNGFGLLATHVNCLLTSVSLRIEGNNFTQMNAQTNNAAGYGITGIELEFPGSDNHYDILNNMIGGLKLTRTVASSAGQLCGIRHTASNNASLRILHNSISLLAADTTYTGLNTTNCMGFGVTSPAFTGTVDFRNNIVRIAQPDGVAICRASTLDSWTSNYNDLSSTAGARCARYGSTDYATLPQWQAQTGQDQNSRDIDPTCPNTPFGGSWIHPHPVSSDLHFNAYPGSTYAAPPLEGISDDIDGDERNPGSVYMGADEMTVQPAGLPDADGDSIPDSIEGTADGNGDSIPDSSQPNVATVPSAVTGSPISIASEPGTKLVAVASRTNPSPFGLPQGTMFPQGFFAFTVQGVEVGGVTTVTLHMPSGVPGDSYHKYGPVPGNPLPAWYNFSFDGTTGAKREGNSVILVLKDGDRGDSDLMANGSISDPGAPSYLVETPVQLSGFGLD